MTRNVDHGLQAIWPIAGVVSLCLVAGCGGGGDVDDATPAADASAESGEPTEPAGRPDRTDGGGDVVEASEPMEPESREPLRIPIPETDLSFDPEATPVSDEGFAAAELERQLVEFQVPPDWLSLVASNWDVAGKPWSEARIEIRRLLGENNEDARREGIRLTWDYLQKEDIGNGHEYGMYMFLGNEPLWAIIAYREFVNREDIEYPPYFGLTALASLYTDYGLFEEAERELLRGVEMRPPDPAWYEMREAEMHDALGDLYVAWGRHDDARASYREAIRLYPLGKPPYGQHLLPRRANKVQSKLDLLDQASLQDATLRNGNYRETALGYSGDINLTVTVEAGRIADISVAHQEKIDQDACRIIPARIIDQQSLQVDGISGATVTRDAIVDGTLRAMRQAGLE